MGNDAYRVHSTTNWKRPNPGVYGVAEPSRHGLEAHLRNVFRYDQKILRDGRTHPRDKGLYNIKLNAPALGSSERKDSNVS